MENEFVPNKKILYVDDEENLLSAFRSLMRKENFEIVLLQDSEKIMQMLYEHGPFAVVISDQKMPNMTGVDVLEKVKLNSPESIRILLTGYSDFDDTTRAINQAGITHYISKPWDDIQLKQVVHECITQYNLILENAFLLEELKTTNASLAELLDGTVVETVHLLSDMIANLNPLAAQQTERIRKIGQAYLKIVQNISPEERWDTLRAFDLFNLGLVMLPPLIQVAISKDGLSAVDRFQTGKTHFILAAHVLEHIPRFINVAKIIKFQQRDYNGEGEPHNEWLQGEKIPFGARLLHILLDLDKRSTEKFRGYSVLQQMLQESHKYDKTIINTMLNARSTQQKIEAVEQTVHVKELQAGMIALEDIVSMKGTHLITARTQLTETSIKMLGVWLKSEGIKEPIKVVIPKTQI